MNIVDTYDKMIAKIQTLEHKSKWPILYSFVMTRKEKKIFDENIKKAKNYIEFGLGGSSIRALQKSKTNIHCVESSIDWITLMKKYEYIRGNINQRLFLHHVDIGPTGNWGHPINDDCRESFPDYSSNIFETVDINTLDLVLVDGRFRVACALKAILACHSNPKIKIMFHDFWQRERYHVILNHLDVLEKVDSLGVFTIKKNVDLAQVAADYDVFKYVSD